MKHYNIPQQISKFHDENGIIPQWTVCGGGKVLKKVYSEEFVRAGRRFVKMYRQLWATFSSYSVNVRPSMTILIMGSG